MQIALVELTKNDELRADTLKNVQQEVYDTKVLNQENIQNLNDTVIAQRNVQHILYEYIYNSIYYMTHMSIYYEYIIYIILYEKF